MMGADDGPSKFPPVANQNLWVQACYSTLSIPPTMVKWVNVRSKQLSKIKGIRCIYLKVIMIKYDTYHDTLTNYLMEQESSMIQVQAEGDGCCCY
jgi:hypothetical protein